MAADLLSQAEHGVDSQVVLLAVDLPVELMEEIEEQIDAQAKALPRVDILQESLKKSLIVQVPTRQAAIEFSNDYAPEHLILHLTDADSVVDQIQNAGSVFVGPWTPERYGFKFSAIHNLQSVQLWRLCFWHKSYFTNEWVCSPVQRREHVILPKAYHLSRNNKSWFGKTGTCCYYHCRCGGPSCSCKCCSHSTGRKVNYYRKNLSGDLCTTVL